MTKRLEAFERVAGLPDREQDAFACWPMDELASERRWPRAFEASQGQLAEMAREALEDELSGRTEPLDPHRL